ncbi:MAG: hypothetical protein AAF738_03395, partial [Bacteroidota bacterium]
STAQSVTFEFDNPDSDFYIYSIAVNEDNILVDTTNLNSINFGGLSPSDEVEITIAPLDIFTCNNVERTTQICRPIQCTETDALVDITPFYCFDSTAIQIMAEPSGGIFNGNGITQSGLFTPSDVVEGPTTITYQFLDANGCMQMDTFQTEVVALPIPPVLDCSNLTSSAASFVWTHPDPDARFQYEVSINGDPFSTAAVTADRMFTQTGLSPGTTVIIRVSTLSPVACGISAPVSFTCTTPEDCPNVSIDINPIASICLGLDDTPVELVADFPDNIDVANTIWSGLGVTGNVLDPTSADLETGRLTIEFVLTSQNGCTYRSSVEVDVQLCGDGILAGMVATEEGVGVNVVQLNLLGETPQTTQTDFDGTYSFENVESNTTYQLALNREDMVLNGVSVFDMVVIQRHILNTVPLTSPYKLIAADVNGSNSVTVSDLVAIRRVLLNIETTFPIDKSWRFLPADFQFSDPANPWSTPLPDEVAIDIEVMGLTQRNFIAIKLGDLNGNAFLD